MEYLIRQLLSVFRRPKFPLRTTLRNAGNARTPIRNTQFIGYLEGCDFRRYNPVRQERSLNRRRMAGQMVALLLLIGIIWVMIESAHALDLF